ncbi:MAG: pyridoxal-phosphate dependent enzyme [Polyangiaceae bacterium]
MRCVAATSALGSHAPDSTKLDAVRYLGQRFASARLRDVAIVRSRELDATADPTGNTRVWLALETLQVTGSFKVRGALVALDAHRSARRVVTASGGNHGVGVAYAASVLGMYAVVCVPRSVSPTKRAKIDRYGASMVVVGSDRPEDVEAQALRIAAEQDAVYISSYDDIDVVIGNGSSLGFEIVRALGGLPDRILAPVGSGGLATGLSWAFNAEGRSPVERMVWGAQSERSCAVARWLERPLEPARPPIHGSLAKALAGGRMAAALARAESTLAGIVVLSEDDVRGAVVGAYRDLGLVLEASAAVALAPTRSGLPAALCGGDLVVVLSGRNVDPGDFESTLESKDN